MNHWIERTISEVFEFTIPGDWGRPATAERAIPVLRSTNFRNDGKIAFDDINFRDIEASRLVKRTIKRGDVLIEKSGGSTDQPAGRIVYCDTDLGGTCSNFIELGRVKQDFDSKFIFYLLFYLYRTGLVLKYQQQTTGIINFKLNEYKREKVHIPQSETEQSRIAAVLSCVDSAIEETEKLIAKEQLIHTGLMQDLLTKGTDDHGNIRFEATHEFKDSRVGRIPIEWDAVTLKEALKCIDAGKSPTCLTRPAGAGEWGVLKVSAIRPDGFQANENKAVKSAAHINTAYEVKNGDLLISRANTYELVGIVCFVRKPIPQLMLCDKTLRLNVNKKRAAAEFLFHVLQMPSVRSQIEINATGSSGSMKNISQTTIENLLIPLPLPEEQEMIIRRLNSHNLYSSAEVRKLEKLTRIKQGLMQDLLTGTVSVENLEQIPIRA